MSRRRPVVLDCYGDVRSGHLPSEHPASRGSVAAVPIWWLGEVIGANVVFAGRAHRFGSHQVDELEMLAQVAAPGIVRAGWSRPLTARWGAAHPGSAGCPLTPRERQVLGLVGRGMSDREVAAALVISPKTAEKHVAAALRKTGAARRTGAVLRALDRGWLSADLVGDD
jgi:DNA-binding CsgD family transcriptional regulator